MSNLVLDLATNTKNPYILSASILKPLYVWFALKKFSEKQLSQIDVEAIITKSDNVETDKLIEILTLKDVTENFNLMLKTRKNKTILEIPETWGSYKITGKVIYELYSAFLQDETAETKTVLNLMRQTPENQRFSFINPDYSTKAGWDLVDGQMSLLIVNITGNQIQVFVTTSYPLNEKELRSWHWLKDTTPEEIPLLYSDKFERQLKLFKKLADI